ncbi:MAG: TonB-dependent receptor [Rhodospirillaceae bacterium]|nr:TonB-dependent receptor [Rhodospirillaceae bacterium]
MTKKLLLGTTIAAVAFASSAFAQNSQQQAQAQTGGLEEIVVTAQRREEAIQTVPVAVSAFSAESLERRQVTQANDLERYVPSLKMRNNITSPTNLSPSLRGSLQQDASLIVAESPFGIYVDDVYIGRLNGNNVTLSDIERVEVLRGPQGTLYGRNTLAGAIKFMSRTPSPDSQWLNAEVGYGSYGSYRAAASMGGGIGEKVGASLSLQKNRRGAYSYNIATAKEVGEENNFAGRGKLYFEPTDTFNATVSVSHTDSDNDALQLVPAITPGVANTRAYRSRDVKPVYGYYTVSRPVRTITPSPLENEPRGETKQWIASANLNWDFGDFSLQSITGFVNTNDFFSNDFSGTGGVAFITAAANGGSIGGVLGATKVNADQFTQELKFQGDALDGKLNYIAGAYYLNETATQQFGWNIGLLGGPVSNSDLTASTESISFYGQADYALTDALKATAGLRWVQDDKDFGITFTSRSPIIPAQNPINLDNKYERWTPKFGLDYTVPTSGAIDSLLLYVSAARGFKSGGYNGINITDLAIAGASYGPESNWTYEGGMKADFLDNRVRFNAAYFYNRISDLTLNATVPSPIPGVSGFPVQNAGDATIKGLEIEASAVPTDGLTLYLNAAMMSGKFRNLVPSAAPSRAVTLFGVTNPDTPQTPDLTTTLGFDYRVPLNMGAADTEFLVGADWYHTSSFTTAATNDFILDGYDRFNAYVGLGFGNGWEGKLAVKNLTDERDLSTGSRGFLGGFLYLPPMEYMFTIKYAM